MRSEAYNLGAAMLLMVTGVILAALAFEHIGGYIPCPLCLQQRYAYYAGVPLLFLALVLVTSDRPKFASAVFLIIAFAFLANAGLGIYQAGAEWKFWPGPSSCAPTQAITPNAEDLFSTLGDVRIIRCDEPSFRFAGISFAGWNALISFLVFVFTLKAAFKTSTSRR